LKELEPPIISAIAGSMQSLSFMEGDIILMQGNFLQWSRFDSAPVTILILVQIEGDPVNDLFIVDEGECDIYVKKGVSELEAKVLSVCLLALSRNDYFTWLLPLVCMR
jgi:hypothetical protein